MEGSLVKAVVNLDAIGKNVSVLNGLTGKDTQLMAVVKADGYGHGAVAVAKKALESGASRLGVARLHEAIELRNAGIIAPILVFGYVHPSNMARVIDCNITLSVYNLEMATAFSAKAEKYSKKLNIHLKVDTGMGRVGMIIKDPTDAQARKAALEDIELIVNLPAIDLEGIYTHFAAADHKDRTYTLKQIDVFESLLFDLKEKGIQVQIRHAANSAGIMEFEQSHFDMVRAGIALYGLYPSNEVDQTRVTLTPAMTLTSLVSAVRQVPKGFKTSYGMTWETKEATILASVPIGYADGFSRRFSSNGWMLVNGSRAPIVGRVCMDQTMIDVGKIPGVQAGDEVVVFGCQGKETLSADELADRAGTINYEIVSALTARVRKVYSDSGSG
ncbi:MAG: alanine racemase [Pseudomonadota bacterium]